MTDNHLTPCEVCDGLGVVTKAVPVGHPDFGKTFPCPACSTYEERRLTNIIQMSRLDLHTDKTFAVFETDMPYLTHTEAATLRSAYLRAMEYAKDPDGWLILRGNCGTGKTHLAAAIGHEAVHQGIRTIFVTAPDFLDHLRATFAPHSDITYDQQFEQVCNVPLLILDDLGAESPTLWAQEKLYQLINHRYTAKLPTIITTNIDINLMGERIASRLEDERLAENILIQAQDYRRAGKMNNAEIMELSNLDHHRSMIFDNFKVNSNEMGVSLKRAAAYADDPTGWVVLVGGHGSGKTHLAAAIANHWSAHHPDQSALLVSTADLLDYLRAAFAPDVKTTLDNRFKAIRRCPLLVLEDFQISEKTPSWSREKLFQLIDYRYLAKIPTVVTLHIEKQRTLEQNHFDFSSRLSDSTLVQWIVLQARDYRYNKR